MRRDWWSYLYGVHRNTLERLMRQGRSAMIDRLLATSAEAVVHDFFRNNSLTKPRATRSATSRSRGLKTRNHSPDMPPL